MQDLRGSGAGESEWMWEERRFPTRSDVSVTTLPSFGRVDAKFAGFVKS